MSFLPFNRLALIGLLLLIPGLYFGVRFTSGFLRVSCRKFRRGRPYLRGSASDYFLFAAGSVLMALVGGALTAAASLQGGLQPFSGPTEVGRVFAETGENGTIRLTLSFEGDYPDGQHHQVEVEGAQWALEGAFMSWRFTPAWLGFRDGHRVENVLGTSAAPGAADRPVGSQERVSGSYLPWSFAHRNPTPVVDTHRHRTPWMPADGRFYRIFASVTGYVLVEEGSAASISPSS